MKRAFLLLLILSITYFSASAQINYQQFTTEDGLPSNEVYDIVQDSKGFVWIATDRGVARYDGYDFQVFTTKDGLNHECVINIFPEDRFGRLWFLDYSHNLYYFENHRFHKHPVYLLHDKTRKPLYSIFVKEDSTLILGRQYDRLEVTPDGNMKKLPDSLYITHGFVSAKYQEEEHRKHIRHYTYYIDFLGKTHIIKNDDVARNKVGFYTGYHDSLLIVDGLLVKYQAGQWHKLDSFANITRNIITLNGRLYLTEHTKGVHELSTLTKKLVFKQQGTSCAVTVSNHEIWIGTLDNGILVVKGFDIQQRALDDNIIGIAAEDSTLYYIVKTSNELRTLKNSNVHHLNWKLGGVTVPEMNVEKGSIFIGMRDGEFKGLWNVITREKLEETYVQFGIDNHNEVWKMGRKSIYKGDWAVSVDFFIFSHYTNGDLILLGSEQGLALLDTKTKEIKRLYDSIPDFTVRINSIEKVNDHFIFGTMGNGLLITDKHHNYFKIDTRKGLTSDHINHLYKDSETGVFWVSTTKGISRIEHITDSTKMTITNFTVADGLSSDEINMSCVYNDTIWIASSRGINYFQKDLKKYYPKPLLYIDNIKINGRDTSLNLHYDLAYNQNNIRINFTALDYVKPGTLKYKYRLKTSTDSLWNTTSDRFAIFNSLSDGEFQFELRAINIDNTESEVKTITFAICEPFWKTWWFILVVTSFFLMITVIATRIRIRQIRNREHLKEELYEVRQQALNSQINPHFIFNSLNSIQNYIFKNDLKNSNKYLSLFSKLMRDTLENSNKKMITLEKELHSLEMYLSLEKLRFKEQMTYSIVVDQKVDTDNYYIPPMLFQPFVENSVWHGIMHKNTTGTISISVREHRENSIAIIIEDNGVGRKASAELQHKNKLKHKSAGLDITMKRVQLIRELYQKNITYKILDLYDAAGKESGTRVEFIIPMIEYEISI